MKTGGIQAEVLADYTASSFINCLIRHAARRPGVQHIFSDCGTNFTAAEKELKSELLKWKDKIEQSIRLRGIQWSFNPPGVPWQSGKIERMVKSIKKVMYAILNNISTPSDDVLHTVVVRDADSQ